MKKQLPLYSAVAGLAAAVAVTAATVKQFEPQQLPKAPAEQQLTPLEFIATMNQSLDWTSTGAANMQFAIYSFTPGADRYATRLSKVESAKVADAGVYFDGYYYTFKVPTNSTYFNYSTTLNRYDIYSWERKQIASFGTGSGNVAEDMTVDYISGNVYAVGMDTYMGSTRQLKTVDLLTGEMTPVGPTEARIYSIAADGDGQLWGVGTPAGSSSPTNLYRIDKTTGRASEATRLDINLYTGSLSSLTFDLRDGKLYMVGQTYTENKDMEREFLTGIYRIDQTDGKVEVVQPFDYQEILAGLALRDCHPKAPKAAADLRFEFAAGSTTKGKVAFTVPTLSYDGTRLSAPLRAEIYVDGVKSGERSGLIPGDSFASDDLTLAEGKSHDIRLFCHSGEAKSLPGRLVVFAGTDTPAAPTDISVEVSADGGSISAAWEASKSLNGGYIDASRLCYQVVLMPDNKVIASDLTDTRLDYRFDDRKMGVSQLKITAKIGNTSSQAAVSDIFLAGTPWPIPYLEAFNYPSETMWPMTTVDANHDGGDYGFYWLFDYNRRAAWYYSSPSNRTGYANDWLITPAIAFDTDHVYRLQIDTYGYMGGVNTMEIALGKTADPADLTHRILRHEYPTYGYSSAQPLNLETIFVAEDGDCRVGIHNVSNNTDHMFVDNIFISVYGPTTIPAAPTGLELTNTDGKVKIAFDAPTLTAGGKELGTLKAVKIYRRNLDGELLTAIGSVAPGKHCEFTDPSTTSGLKTYVVVAENDEGAGMPAEASINTFADIPRAVQNLTVTPRNGWSEALVEWQYPASMTGVNGGTLTDDDLAYDIYRTIDNSTSLVARDVKECSFFDSSLSEAFPEGKRQTWVSYRVAPRTNGGEGASTTSDKVMMGLSYPLPFKESWAHQRTENFTWTSANLSYGASWNVNSDVAFDPRCTCQDGDYGQASLSGPRDGSGGGDYVSPRIDMASYENPRLTFHLYRSTSADCANSSLHIGFSSDEYSREILPTAYPVHSSADGWEEYTIDIPEKFAKSSRVAVILSGYVGAYKGQIHVDNLTVTGEKPAREIKVERIVGAQKCLIGMRNTYDVEVSNIGREAVTDVNVEFFVDDRPRGVYTIPSIAAGESAMAPFELTPGLENEERTLRLRAVATCEGDGSEANNSIEATVALSAPMLPYVTAIDGYSDEETAHLVWDEPTVYPHVETVTDDVETYTPWAIDNIGQWRTYDADGEVTARINVNNTTLEWDNAGKPQAFIVFNPTLAGAASVIRARSGAQCFVSMSARNSNDDWLISPRLSGEAQTLTFYAKCLYPTDLNERFELWVSDGSPEIEDFTCISGSEPVAVTSYNDWIRQSFPLPAGTKFFAIRCVSVNQTGLMIDDITYSPAHSPIELLGFNIYREGLKVNTEAVGDFEYIDSDVEVGKSYTYAVSALYDGGESIYSRPIEVQILKSGIADVDGADGATAIAATAGGILVKAPESTLISVSTVSGLTLYRLKSAGVQTLPAAPGIYIVRAGDTTAKLRVR